MSAISFETRPALTPDEAHMRVLVQARVNEFGGGFMIMALTLLGALLKPGREAAGSERTHALSAIQKNIFISACLIVRADAFWDEMLVELILLWENRQKKKEL